MTVNVLNPRGRGAKKARDTVIVHAFTYLVDV